MVSYQGIVRDNVVLLPEGVHLADGLEVEIRTPMFVPDANDDENREDLLDERLRAAGLITGPTRRSKEAPPPIGERTPIVVKGKPLSQTIIDERR